MKRLVAMLILVMGLSGIPFTAFATPIQIDKTATFGSTTSGVSGVLGSQSLTVVANTAFDITVSVFDDGTHGDLTGFGFGFSLTNGSSPLATNISFNGYSVASPFDDVSGLLGLPPHQMAGLYDPADPSNAGMEVLLATLSFSSGALSGGSASLDINGLFNNFDSGLFYVEGSSGSGVTEYDGSLTGSLAINVIDAAQIPEPATLMLFGLGLLGLTRAGRKHG
jgi:hypothetical protein